MRGYLQYPGNSRSGTVVQSVVQRIAFNTILLLSAACMMLSSGCGKRAENLTVGHEGRRVGDYDVDSGKIAYVWYPAQHDSTQGHLVLLDIVAGREVELESNLSGPMAMCRGRIVWANSRKRDEEGRTDVSVYDIGSGQTTAIAHARIQDLDADGDHVVWGESHKSFGSDIILYDFQTMEQQTISEGGAEGDVMNRDPSIGDGTVAWEAYDRRTRASRIAIYDIETGNLSTIDAPQAHPKMSISGNNLVYCRTERGSGEVHLYDIAAGIDSVVVSVERLVTSPYIEGDRIAWCEHIRKEEFKGIPGQPLMDEKDIRNVYVCDVGSGKKRLIAKNLLATGGRVSVHGGSVYLNVYREFPPPGRSNLVVPVDLWVW